MAKAVAAVAVAAVAGEVRFEDHYAELPADVAEPSWVYRRDVLRSVRHRPGDGIALYHDAAGGTMRQDAALHAGAGDEVVLTSFASSGGDESRER